MATPALAVSVSPIVYVSIPPQRCFLEQVAGERVTPRVMVEPGHSPATYAPTPRQLVDLSSALACFRIGAPFENVWVPRLQAVNPEMMIVDTAEGIPLRAMANHSHDHDAGDGVRDPHVWTSPPLIEIQAAHMRDAMSALDPGNRAIYAEGYARFAQRLRALDTWIRSQLRGHEGKPFMVFHPSWGYYAETYGLRQLAVELEGKEPGARQLAAIIEQARSLGIKAIFVQPQFSTHLAETIAQAIGNP